MSELEQQQRHRRDKRRALRAAGHAAYPARVSYDLEPSAVCERYEGKSAEELEALGDELRVPGRVRALRRHGKTSFLDLHDGAGRLQVMVRASGLDAGSATVLEHLDLGDYLLARGRVMRTRTGELTVAAEELVPLAKALRPLPEKWHGLADVETRYRRRYLDLLVNPESRRVFELRAATISFLRQALEREGFLEVETPMMQPIAGGAAARPFVTHHNALDLELYLRVAPELYLKRLLVGGFHRVYEINRNFRNEGVSTQHNPEFTMLEFYWAYSDYLQLMDFTERLVRDLATAVLGEPALTWQGRRFDLSRPWPRLTMRQAVFERGGVDESALADAGTLAAELRARDLEPPAHAEPTYGTLLATLFGATVEEDLVEPIFIYDFPVEVSPLAKPGADRRFAERFELFAGGMEIANGYSELNDPDVQAERFRSQLERAGVDPEVAAHRFDADYVEALEHGMPPAGGEGIGIDRLTMLLTDSASIRDVILFPLLRPEAG